jgi:hypothetical protein
MLGRWVKESDSDDGLAFRGNGQLTPDQEENRKLKAQVKRLKMERDILKKATVFFAAKEVKYSFITQHKDTYPISLQCQVLGVRHKGYYHYRRHTGNKPVNPEHEGMLLWIQALAKASDDTYGSQRMKIAMGCLGYPNIRSKARKLMKEAIVAVRHRKKYKVTTNSNHKQPMFENLVHRQFEVAQTELVIPSCGD